MSKTNKILFNNTELAFSNKSDVELNKAYFLFSILDYSFLTKLGNFFLMLVLKMHLPLKKVIKKTIFNHFCGGETLDECKKTFQTKSSLSNDSNVIPSEYALFQKEVCLHFKMIIFCFI